jgi:hypothetical protein
MAPHEAFRQCARENRERAETQGIGLDTDLSPMRFYSIEELIGRELKDWEFLHVVNEYFAEAQEIYYGYWQMNQDEFRKFARENRRQAEAQGIGLESKLSRITRYTLEEHLGRKLKLHEEYLRVYMNAREILGECRNSW